MRLFAIRASLSFVLALLAASAAFTEAPRLTPRVTQYEVENYLSLYQLRIEGQRIFSTPFNAADGLGDGPVNATDKASPGGRPTFLNHGSLLRFNGLDSQTCLECHNYSSMDSIPARFAVGGFGALGQMAAPGVIDPDLDDSENNGHARVEGRVINPPFIFGSGGIELLGKEMTTDLQAQKAQAFANPGTSFDLVSKGVNFGSISYDGAGFDYSTVEGIGEDLVVRPFGRIGCCATVREFDVGAMQFHHGIQPVEVVGADNDADGDGVVNELLEGELSAMHIFQASLQRPRQRHRWYQSRQEIAGRDVFDDLGCAGCHVPKLVTHGYKLPLSLPEVPEDPSANVYFEINLRRFSPGFTPSGSGIEVPLFADLKLHDMGPGLAEESGNSHFQTARLWGVSDSAPYLHDGRALSLTSAISQHGGEARPSADGFNALSEEDRAALIGFLNTLKTPRFSGIEFTIPNPYIFFSGDFPDYSEEYPWVFTPRVQ